MKELRRAMRRNYILPPILPTELSMDQSFGKPPINNSESDCWGCLMFGRQTESVVFLMGKLLSKAPLENIKFCPQRAISQNNGCVRMTICSLDTRMVLISLPSSEPIGLHGEFHSALSK